MNKKSEDIAEQEENKEIALLLLCANVFGAIIRQNTINMAIVSTFIEVTKTVRTLGNSEVIVKLEKLLDETKLLSPELDGIDKQIHKLATAWVEEERLKSAGETPADESIENPGVR